MYTENEGLAESQLTLAGCHPAPLASYLKALAVLRLVSRQVDGCARGAWRADRFVLQSKLDRCELVAFFLDDYQPTPIVAPWNGGSGFYDGDRQDGIGEIEQSTDPRFALFRRVIQQVRSWPEIPPRYRSVGQVVGAIRRAVDGMGDGKEKSELLQLLEKEREARRLAAGVIGESASDSEDLAGLRSRREREVKNWNKVLSKMKTRANGLARKLGGKEALQRASRSRLPEEALGWLDAAFVVNLEGKTEYGPVLATGGNEGRLDYTVNYMRHLVTLLGPGRNQEKVREWLEAALFGEAAVDLPVLSIGQLDPGRAGGFNQGSGYEAKDFTANPWDFVLMMEGAAMMAGAVHKRLATGGGGALAAPFAVRHVSAGFASSGQDDARPEMWMPLWDRPATLGELIHVFREGRASIGRRDARTALDFTRAVRTWGVSRGVESFVRHVFVKRRGDSYVALPAGRIGVRFDGRVRLLDDLDPILDRVDQYLRGMKSVPARLTALRRRVNEAAFDCALQPSSERFCTLLEALGYLDEALAVRIASGGGTGDTRRLPGPLGGLRPAFLQACDDGSLELRVAAALAGIRSSGSGAQCVGPLRANLVPVAPARPWSWATGHAQRHWVGSTLVERLCGVVRRRLMDAGRLGTRVTPFQGALALHPGDVAAFIWGETDDGRIERLLWGLLLLRWDMSDDAAFRSIRESWRLPVVDLPIPRAWAMVKLALWPGPVRDAEVRPDPQVVALLDADRLPEALDVARHRLRVAGLTPLPLASQGGALDPHRLLAGLLPPVRGQRRLASLVLHPPSDGDTHSPTSAPSTFTSSNAG